MVTEGERGVLSLSFFENKIPVVLKITLLFLVCVYIGVRSNS